MSRRQTLQARARSRVAQMLGLASAIALQLAGGAAIASDEFGMSANRTYRTQANSPTVPNNAEDGLRAGNYLIYPWADLQSTFDDNVKDENGERGSDWRTQLGAGVTFRSDLPRHMLDVIFSGRIVSFAEHSDQDYEDGLAHASFRIDIDHGNALGGELETALRHEEKLTAEGLTDAAEAVPVWASHLRLAYVHDIGKLAATFGVDAARNDYDDVHDYAGATIDQDYRDVERLGAFARLDYRFSPAATTYLGLRTEREDHLVPDESDRDALIHKARAGVQLELTPLVMLTLSAGYAYKVYDESIRSDFGAYLWSAELQWVPTEMTTVKLSASQELAESSLAAAEGRLDTVIGARLEQELGRQVNVALDLAVTGQEFLGLERVDDVYWGRASLEYELGENVLFTIAYEHQERDSSEDRFDSDDNRYTAGVKVHF